MAGFCLLGNVEAEFNDIAILHDVFLAFDAEFGLFLRFGHGTAGNQILVRNDLGGNEAALEVSVDDTGRAGGFVAGVDGPGSGFLDTGGEVGSQPEQVIHRADEVAHAGVLDADIVEVFAGLGRVEFGELLLDAGGDDDGFCVVVFGYIFADRGNVGVGIRVFHSIGQFFFAHIAGEDTLLVGKQEEAARQEAIKNAQSKKAYAASVAELDLLAALIYCEANIEPYEAKVAVGAVVMNRLEKGTYGSTLVDVIYQPEQFTPALNGLVNSALKNGKVNESCYQAAREVLAGVDNTNGAMYFNDWHPELDGAGIMYGNMVFYYKWVPH